MNKGLCRLEFDSHRCIAAAETSGEQTSRGHLHALQVTERKNAFSPTPQPALALVVAQVLVQQSQEK